MRTHLYPLGIYWFLGCPGVTQGVPVLRKWAEWVASGVNQQRGALLSLVTTSSSGSVALFLVGLDTRWRAETELRTMTLGNTRLKEKGREVEMWHFAISVVRSTVMLRVAPTLSAYPMPSIVQKLFLTLATSKVWYLHFSDEEVETQRG